MFSSFDFPLPPKDVPLLRETHIGKGKGLIVEYILANRCSSLLELGSFLGGSIEFWFNACPSLTKIVAVDKWPGNWAGSHCRNLRYNHTSVVDISDKNVDYLNSEDGLYHVFLKNMLYYRDKLIPMRMDIYEAIENILSSDFRPDVVYLDADKSFQMLEKVWLSFNETSLVCGDDYRWKNGD